MTRRTSGHEERLGLVEAHPADGSVVLVEPIDERPHPVIPQLDHPAVQRREDPWPLRVEREALHAVRLGLHRVAFVRTWTDVNEVNGSARSMETRAIEPRRVRNPERGNPFNKDGASPRSRAYLELGEHRDPIGGEPPPRSADGVRETNSRGRYSGRRTASARRSLSARARQDAHTSPRVPNDPRPPRAAKRLQSR